MFRNYLEDEEHACWIRRRGYSLGEVAKKTGEGGMRQGIAGLSVRENAWWCESVSVLIQQGDTFQNTGVWRGFHSPDCLSVWPRILLCMGTLEILPMGKVTTKSSEQSGLSALNFHALYLGFNSRYSSWPRSKSHQWLGIGRWNGHIGYCFYHVEKLHSCDAREDENMEGQKF